MKAKWVLVALLAFTSIAPAQELVLKGDTTTVKVARTVYDDREAIKKFPFTVTAPNNAIRPEWKITPSAGVTWSSKTRTLTVTAAPKGELTISAEWSVASFDGKTVILDDKDASIVVLIGVEPPAPPEPPKPPTPPVPPPPVVVTSFRVIMVYESADTLPAAQTSVLYGKTVENFLDATCTGGKAGWRRRDKDSPGENDPAMVQIWSAVKGEFAPPKNTKTPAVVVQVNEKIDIIPLAATPAEMVAILTKYAKGEVK